MIDKLKKAIAEAEKASAKCDDRRFYDGYITALKYALVLAKKERQYKAMNPFIKEVE